MKSKMMAGVALLAMEAQASKLSPGELADMFKDPEYADTWRWTNDERYVEEFQWAKDSPKGYKDELGIRENAFMQSDEALPDYWSYDYSPNKHWGFAGDPYYASPDTWIASSPKGYDDYVNMQSQSQVNLGVTFYPGREPQHLAQIKSKSEVPDYWSFDYSGLKHWRWAEDPYYADPDEWVKSAPKAYDSLVQIQSKPFPGVTFINQP